MKRKTWKKGSSIIALALAAGLLLTACSTGGTESQAQQGGSNGEPEIPVIPEVAVEFGNEPYMDHTQM